MIETVRDRPFVLGVLLSVALAGAVDAPWREALPGYSYTFPRDHFEHPEFRTEWWYYTGNVWTDRGQRFGFELVFFRRGETRGPTSPSNWTVRDVYLAHAAMTDAASGRFTSSERLNREGPGIAGASFKERRIWNGNWSVQWGDDAQKLDAITEDFRFSLNARSEKPPVVHGEKGVSQKASDQGRASHYVSLTRLAVSGIVETRGRRFTVHGQAWMDHEWFTNQLKDYLTGWDWFSVQFEDRTELMLFQLRRKDGSVDPFSAGTGIRANGTSRHLRRDEFDLRPLRWWRSSKTRARYPVAWVLSVPSERIQLECRAVQDDQELRPGRGAPVYWEGAVDYSGSQKGVGYLEMTGYAGAVRLE